MNAAKVIPFHFEKVEVRTLLINDQPWFFAIDVCAALALTDTNKALIGLDDDEKCEHEQYSGSGRKPILINESGLYSLILRSRKSEAKRFKKWVTAEVLPAIRQHGHYQDTRGRMETLLGQTIGPHGFKMLNAVLEGKLGHLPLTQRQAANQHIWAQVHTAFGVSQGADIPAEQLDSARNFIAAYNVHEGEWLPKAPEILTPEEQRSPQQSNLLRFRYNDRPFRCVVEGAQLWFVTADVGNALYLGDASHINPFLTPEQRGHRWVGRQRLNVLSQSGLERAMVQAELKWTLPFRRWLDEVLAQVSGGAPAPAKAIGLSSEQQSLLRDLVKNRIQALPQQQQGKAAQKCWGALKSRFNTPNYKAIAPEQFCEAVSLIARLPLLPAAKPLDLHYPISDWQAKSPELFRQDDPKSPDLLVNFHDLGKSAYSPCLELLDKLAESGYCIDGAFYEFRSYQNQKFHADSMLHTLSYNVRRLLDDVERRRGYPQEYPKVK